MNQRIYNNKSYILNKKTSNSITVWILMMIIIIVISILFLVFYQYIKEEKVTGFYNGNLVVYIKKEDVSNINNYTLKLNDEILEFQVVKINNEYLIDNEIYYEIVIDSNLDDSKKIINNVFTFVLEKEYTTYLKEIKRRIKWN